MISYRIAKAEYVSDLSGRGAEKAGGRWNSKGLPVLYSSASRALAAMELAVHLPFGLLPRNYKIVTIEFTEHFGIFEFDQNQLPENWRQYPFPSSTQKIGNFWLKSLSEMVMKVPSVVVDGEFNILINPLHPDFHHVKIVEIKAFEFDLRLFS
ncbi:MAG: RES family NAD+ phosphorylase [Bacteroidales bacterium]|nr:RES family NAD+ phosphorylase [Bacteroidales bacterium]